MGLGLEVGDGEVDGFFLLGVIKGIQLSLEFLDRVLMVLFVISFGGVQGGRGSAVDTFLQLLLLFLISTSVESSEREKKAKLIVSINSTCHYIRKSMVDEIFSTGKSLKLYS